MGAPSDDEMDVSSGRQLGCGRNPRPEKVNSLFEHLFYYSGPTKASANAYEGREVVKQGCAQGERNRFDLTAHA
jgi:hypothetical protein